MRCLELEDEVTEKFEYRSTKQKRKKDKRKYVSTNNIRKERKKERK